MATSKRNESGEMQPSPSRNYTANRSSNRDEFDDHSGEDYSDDDKCELEDSEMSLGSYFDDVEIESDAEVDPENMRWLCVGARPCFTPHRPMHAKYNW